VERDAAVVPVLVELAEPGSDGGLSEDPLLKTRCCPPSRAVKPPRG
jgi:hypothetical protein